MQTLLLHSISHLLNWLDDMTRSVRSSPTSFPLRQLDPMDISARASTEQLLGHPEISSDGDECLPPTDTDLFFIAPHERELEKKLLRKLDLRVAFFVLLHSINYVSQLSSPCTGKLIEAHR